MRLLRLLHQPTWSTTRRAKRAAEDAATIPAAGRVWRAWGEGMYLVGPTLAPIQGTHVFNFSPTARVHPPASPYHPACARDAHLPRTPFFGLSITSVSGPQCLFITSTRGDTRKSTIGLQIDETVRTMRGFVNCYTQQNMCEQQAPNHTPPLQKNIGSCRNAAASFARQCSFHALSRLPLRRAQHSHCYSSTAAQTPARPRQFCRRTAPRRVLVDSS